MAELKDAWIKTAKSFVLAANDLGIALIDSAKVGREKVMKWAQTDNPDYVQAEANEVVEEEPETAEEPKTEE